MSSTSGPQCHDCGAPLDTRQWEIRHKPGCPQSPKTRRAAIGRDTKPVKTTDKITDKKYLFIYHWRIVYQEHYRRGELQPVGFDEPEYQFALEVGRNHKFDGAWIDQKVAVEIDGGNRMTRQGANGKWYAVGRHTQASDYGKRNLATLLGWRVFFFTPEMVMADPAGCCQIVMDALVLAQKELEA